MTTNKAAALPWPRKYRNTGTTRAAIKRGERGEAREEGDAQPDRSEGERCRPVQAGEHAEIGGDALAALEVSQAGKMWPRKAASPA